MASVEEKRLHVYECRGAGPGWRGIPIPGFLGSWPEGGYCYLFFDRPARDELEAWMRRVPECALTGEHELDVTQWRQAMAPVTDIGPFRVLRGYGDGEPEPEDPQDSGGLTVIRMDPGLAFGSGIHPTTRGCLLAIERLLRHTRVSTAVDLGTGTGILAVACARLGVKRVVAIDRTPLAMATAAANVRMNHVASRVHLLAADGLDVLSGDFDLLVVNIEPAILRGIMKPDHWRAFRTVILSGFLESRRGAAEFPLPDSFELLDELTIDGWPTLTGRIRSGPRSAPRSLPPKRAE